jgi:hypothetical protein
LGIIDGIAALKLGLELPVGVAAAVYVVVPDWEDEA